MLDPSRRPARFGGQAPKGRCVQCGGAHYIECSTVTTDEELASLYRKVQREAGAQREELLLMEEQNMMKQLKELTLVEVAAYRQEGPRHR